MKSLLFSLLISFFTFISPSSKTETPTPSLPPPTIASILATDHSWTATISASRKFTILVTGDILTARTIEARARKTNDYLYPFKPTADFLASADITLVNLETPLTENCPIITTGTIFCGRPENAVALKQVGVDIVSLANNHTYDQKQSGFSSTEKILASQNLRAIHSQKPLELEVKNTKVSFLAYNDIYDMSGKFKPIDLSFLKLEIQKAKQTSQVAIVFFHWGNEYTLKITPRQKALAHTAIESGADLVIASHPHWVQPLEIYQGKLIVYSHGNFVFDQYWSQTTREGVVGEYIFADSQLIDVKYTAIEMTTSGQTIFADREKSKTILSRLIPN